MKRCLLLIILLLIPLVTATLVPPVPSETWVSKEDFICDTCCIENDRLDLTTTITNNGTETLWIGNAKLIDKDNKEFASYKTKDPDFRYGLLVGKSINLDYNGIWPKPTIKNTLYYKQCLYLGTFGKWECEEEYKEKTIAKSVDFQCYKDDECPYDEVCEIEKDCTASKCKTIDISKKCGRIVRGQWRAYECCLNEECKDEQYCLNHNCEQVECVECGYIHDHECVEFECCNDIDCESSQTCINHECKELECDYCEYAKAHECKKYECCKDTECLEEETCEENLCKKISCEKGYIEKHECVLYQCTKDSDCREDLKCEKGFCKKLECEENEIIKANSCEELKTIFGYVKEHRYVSYFSKESYDDNKNVYRAIFVIIAILILYLIQPSIKAAIKEKKRRESYVVVKPKKKH